ncbi:disulfide bond formation protein B [Legionella hackeliae]|uniref:Disulfide bond formation protein B n=1 Tax=Legionella hackeliae TaxID=449 RepID=A0A0A8USQ3_LEGHA|nr:disulfide bond formation protein B [Legionella hackeliae]KTD09936.1 disulfide bond formation protein DsbB [Legionella hackeliae]CEK11763.1 Disulfide bond formation protein B [Legionella hackeliae]STX48534.1 Disulfide bond formation protein B (Disulfide oxidoreductase) [Legionella hackeliae]
MIKLTYKQQQIALFLVSAIVLGCSFYFQYVKGLVPCPLCLMQRFCVFWLVVVGFVGIFWNSLKAVKWLSILQIIVALGGLFFATRQLWLQSLPSNQTPACMPELGVLIRYFPWSDVLHALFWGAGDCAEVSWRWLGLSMPAWSALYFLFMLLTSAWNLWKLPKLAQIST